MSGARRFRDRDSGTEGNGVPGLSGSGRRAVPSALAATEAHEADIASVSSTAAAAVAADPVVVVVIDDAVVVAVVVGVGSVAVAGVMVDDDDAPAVVVVPAVFGDDGQPCCSRSSSFGATGNEAAPCRGSGTVWDCNSGSSDSVSSPPSPET